jgi:predicted enzyme related to lactoylglutathione lyase
VKIYLRVDDLEAYLAKAEQLGGKRVGEPTELPEGWGTVAVLSDPDGNQVGLWK